jgi:hypothetical protein
MFRTWQMMSHVVKFQDEALTFNFAPTARACAPKERGSSFIHKRSMALDALPLHKNRCTFTLGDDFEIARNQSPFFQFHEFR